MNHKRDAASPQPPVRVFCAIELPAEIRGLAAAHITRLRSQFKDARAGWPRPENLHLTVKFLGEIPAGRVESLSQAAELAAQQTCAFKLTIASAGSFPPRGNPRVLWLGVKDDSGGLSQIQSKLEYECAHAGFKREERPFHPHLTIARIRAPQGARALAELHQRLGFEAIQFPVGELVVLRSELGPGGSRYTEISRHALSI